MAFGAARGCRLPPRLADVALLIALGHSSDSTGMRLAVSPQMLKVFRRQLYVRRAIATLADLSARLLPLLRSR